MKNEKDTRLISISTLLGLILSLFFVIGQSFDEFSNFYKIFVTKYDSIVSMLKIFGIAICLSVIIYVIYRIFDDVIEKNNHHEKKSTKKWLFPVIWLIIFILWIPILLNYYPGIIDMDSISQILQATGTYNLSNHHPIFHTMIIKVLYNFGVKISSCNFGVMLYSIFQMAVMSGIFAFSITDLAKKGLNNKLIIILTLFYSIFPVISMYSITMWKDVLFSGVFLIYLILSLKILNNKDIKIKQLIVYSIVILLLMLLRNNGIYIILPMIIISLIMLKNKRERILLAYIIPATIYLILNLILFNIWNIEKQSQVDSMSVPLQQIARVIYYEEENLTLEEVEKLEKYYNFYVVKELYNPRLSDSMKDIFRVNTYKKDKIEFYNTYFKLFSHFPMRYVESLICNSYGYWYPGTEYWVVKTKLPSSAYMMIKNLTSKNSVNIHQKKLVKTDIIDNWISIIDNYDIPFLHWIFSIGFTCWSFLILLFYNIYKKRYTIIWIVYMPLIFLWITILASPVYCEYRYMYAMVIAIPILFANIFINKGEAEDE